MAPRLATLTAGGYVEKWKPSLESIKAWAEFLKKERKKEKAQKESAGWKSKKKAFHPPPHGTQLATASEIWGAAA